MKLNSEQKKELSKLIKEAMGNFSIIDFSRISGVSSGRLSMYLNCKADGIKETTFQSIADASEIDTINLIERFEIITNKTFIGSLKQEKKYICEKDLEFILIQEYRGQCYITILVNKNSRKMKDQILGELLRKISEISTEYKEFIIKTYVEFPELEYLKNLKDIEVKFEDF